MESVFRLMLIRPPVAQDPQRPSIELRQGSPFQVELAAAANEADPRAGLLRVARQFIAANGFVGEPGAVDIADALTTLGGRLDELGQAEDLSRDDVVQAIADTLGAPAIDVIAGAAFEAAVARLRDSILAIKYVQEEHGRPIEALTNLLRDIEVVRLVAADETFPGFAEALRHQRSRSLQLPGEADLASILSSAQLDAQLNDQAEVRDAERRRRIEQMLKDHQVLTVAVGELTSIEAIDMIGTTVEAGEADLVPAQHRPSHVLGGQIDFRQSVADMSLRQLEVGLELAGQPRREGVELGEGGVELAGAALSATPQLLASRPAFRPLSLQDAAFRVTPDAVAGLSAATSAALADRKLSLDRQPLDRVVERLQADIENLGQELDGVFAAERKSVKRIGDTLVTIATPLATPWVEILYGGGISPLLDLIVPDDRIPHTRGEVAPAGIADLLVVNQQLAGYEAVDVAHIENVLKGETKGREHTRRRETEQFTFTETEVTTSEERELESTNRFEMSRETSSTIKEDASLKAGLTVSGKYGPTVEFSASAEGAISRSKEQATKAAASFSKDVTERSANKISERVLERSSLRVTNEVIEKNEHGLDNVRGDGHISGVYQWVNKVYHAQLYNYGLRTTG